MNIQILLIISSICLACGSSSQGKPVVKVSQGILQGTTLSTKNGRTISSFKGIPYGQPPVKELRFSSPLPAKAWNGVYLANKSPNSCPQLSMMNDEVVEGAEDCLYLNVYSPILDFKSKTNGSLLPVMVWIHGGGFVNGNTDFYAPSYILDKDVILVTLQYRLGVFGFFTTGDSVAPGNFALKDQVLALKWVQKNIKSFGGDPRRVTVFGESAGGASVHYLTLSKATDGLFHQYIMQSGLATSPWAFRNRKDYKPFINNVAKNVGCSNKTSTVLIKCMRGASISKLLNSAVHQTQTFPILPWTPTDELESEDAFLTDSPTNILNRNGMKDFPSMSGNVLEEGIVATGNKVLNKNDLHQSQFTFDKVKGYLNDCIDNMSKFYVPAENLSKTKILINDFYFNKALASANKTELLQNYTNFATDGGFFYPEIRLLEKRAKVAKSPLYFYSFQYRGNMTEPNVPHGSELTYLFPYINSSSISKEDQLVIDIMVDLWTSFAINGKPTSTHLENPNIWLPFTSQKTSHLLIGNKVDKFGPCVTLENDFFTSRMNFWKGITSA